MPKRNNFVGLRFGKRIVLAPSTTTPSGRQRWRVQCECGNVFECLAQDLRRQRACRKGGYKGPRPHCRKRPFETNYKSLIQRGRHPVLLSYDEFVLFTKTTECHYCGAPIVWAEYRINGKGGASNLDRKDNDKPYELSNVVVCCLRCNKAKNTHFTYDEWMQLGSVVRNWRALALLQKELEQESR